MPLTQPPGEAQVDFGHAVARIGGRLQKVVFFVMSMVHSDAMFVMAFPRECIEAFLEAHLKAFAFFGFVASRISYDNTKVAVDTNDYSVPVEYGHRPVVIRASVQTVSIYHAGREVARHVRCWEREKQVFDPVHYLSLLDRKPGSLDHARPFAGWDLPEDFAVVRRRLEAQREDGMREYIRVLLLLRDYSTVANP